MNGDHEIGAGFGAFHFDPQSAGPEPEPVEDEWSADAPPLPYMSKPSPDIAGAPADRLLNAANPWIRRAG